MDQTTTPTNTTDTENETPPPTAHPIKSLSFSNGALSNHSPSLHHHLRPPCAAALYRECLKNHAAALGGHAVDGCGEFMPSPLSTPADPTSLKCAACGCHRNFHRRDDDPVAAPHFLDFRRRPPPQGSSPSSSPSPPPYHSSAPHVLLALSNAVAEDYPFANHHPVVTPATPTAAKPENPHGRKRFRTKFSHEQKEKMLSFSEKLGWKMQKSDEGLVEEFCNEIGVGKGVLKVWMHNNKNTFGKRDSAAVVVSNGNGKANTNGRIVNFDSNGHNNSIATDNSLEHNQPNNGDHQVSPLGSPSSA